MAEEKRNSGMPAPPFPAEQLPKSIAAAPRKEAKPAPATPPAPQKSASPPAPAPARPPAPAQEAAVVPGSSPPLFVKVDKYQNIIENIQKLKSYSLGLRDALDALADIEKELQNGLTVLNRALENFNNIIGMLDARLLRIQGIEKTSVETPKEMDEYVKGVYDQMEKIKEELSSIS